MNSLKNLANMRKIISQKCFPVFARMRIQALHVLAQKRTPQDLFLHVLVLCWGVAFPELPNGILPKEENDSESSEGSSGPIHPIADMNMLQASSIASLRAWHRAQTPLNPRNTKTFRHKKPPRVGPRKFGHF